MERNPNKQRKLYIAALLSVCPGLGQQYSGHIYRGIALYILVIVTSWIAAIAFLYASSKFVSLAILFLPVIVSLLVMVDAVYCAKKQPKDYKLKWYNRSWIYFGVFAFLLVTVNPLMDALIGSHVVRAYMVTSESMSPNVLQYDIVGVNKLESPKRGDVVLIGYRDDKNSGAITNIIKGNTLRRIIAVPGEKVEIRGRQVIIDGKVLEEPYVSNGDDVGLNTLIKDDYRWGPDIVPDDEFFVLSDARQFTFDSRIIGFIRKERIIGIASKVFWSWNMNEKDSNWDRVAMSLSR
jgi:signal peptidase I